MDTKVFIDVSGSTGGHANYWNQVIKLVEIHKDDATFYFWDDIVSEVSHGHVLSRASSRTGGQGTKPKCFAHLLPVDCKAVIITDGQVDASEVAACDKIIYGKSFESVEVHFVSTGGNMNLSVSAPFTRSTKYKIFINSILSTSGNSTIKISLQKYFGNVELFLSEAEELSKHITMQNLGLRNDHLRNELLMLQNNLLQKIAMQNTNQNNIIFDQLRDLLINNQMSLAINMIKEMTLNSADVGHKVELIIQELLRLCNGSTDFSFHILEPGRLTRAIAVKDTPTEELPTVESYEGTFECPAMMELDIPILLIKDDKPVLIGLDKKFLDSLINNPLSLLLDESLIQAVKNRLDHLIGLNAAKMLFANRPVTSPFTRHNISCAITFGEDSSHHNATKYALANIFFGNKLIGMSNLWLVVIYFIIKKISYLNQNESFMNTFKEYIIQKCKKTMSNITLSGLPIVPFMKVPMDIAVWYCVVSPFIIHSNKKSSASSIEVEDEDDARNRLRSFGKSSVYLLDILDVFKYSYDRRSCLRLITYYTAFSWMMRQEKTNGSQWRKLSQSLYQNSVRLRNGVIIMLDGPTMSNKIPTFSEDTIQNIAVEDLEGIIAEIEIENSDKNEIYMNNDNYIVMNYKEDHMKFYGPKTIPSFQVCNDAPLLTLGELLALQTFVDKSKSLNVISIPIDLQPIEPSIIINYGYPDVPDFDDGTVICPETMRPYYIDRIKKLNWKLCAEQVSGPLHKQISLYNYFIRYVIETTKYPTKEEFIHYISIKQAMKAYDPMNTLPKHILFYIHQLYSKYERVLGVAFQNVLASEFKAIVCASMNVEDRCRMDGSILFNQM